MDKSRFAVAATQSTAPMSATIATTPPASHQCANPLTVTTAEPPVLS